MGKVTIITIRHDGSAIRLFATSKSKLVDSTFYEWLSTVPHNKDSENDLALHIIEYYKGDFITPVIVHDFNSWYIVEACSG